MRAKLILLLMLGVVTCLCGDTCFSQDSQGRPSVPWFSPVSWFDWSDHRAFFGGRFILTRFVSGSLYNNATGRTYDLVQHMGMARDPQPFGEFIGIFYLDRLGIRFHIAENNLIRGNTEDGKTASELDFSGGRLALDLALLRYPSLALGVNLDYYGGRWKFRAFDLASINISFESDRPVTWGVHAWTIPLKFRDIPFIAHARASFPFPLVNRNQEAKIMEWELSAGLRETVWDFSSFGFTTFSGAAEVGFRSTSVKLDVQNLGDLRAQWQGLFFQASLNY